MLRGVNKYRVHLLVALLLSLGVATFFTFWHPSPSDDLFRYFQWMDILRGDDPGRVWQFVVSRAEFVSTGYMYLISMTGIYGLLQFFPTAATLFIVQYITLDFTRRNKLSMRYAWIAIAAFLGMYEIFMVASGVRSPLAFAVVALVMYLEFIAGSKRARWFYILAPLIHLGSIVPISMRLIYFIRSKKLRWGVLLGLCAILILPVGGLITHLVGFPDWRNPITVNLYKLGGYLSYDVLINGPAIYKAAKVILLAALAVIALRTGKVGDYTKVYLTVCLLTIVSLGHYFIWYRILEFLLIASGPVIVAALGRRVAWRKVLIGVILLFCLVGLRVQAVYLTNEDFRLEPYPPVFDNRAYK